MRGIKDMIISLRLMRMEWQMHSIKSEITIREFGDYVVWSLMVLPVKYRFPVKIRFVKVDENASD